MKHTKKILPYLSPLIILILLGLSFYKILPSCEVEVSSWGECQVDGIQSRNINLKSGLFCRVQENNLPEVQACNYKPCNDASLNISDWGVCIDGKQTRQITKKDECSISEEDKISGKYVSIRDCTVGNKKTTSLTKDYITLVDINGGTSENNNNLALFIKGKVRIASLIVTGKTQVFGGNPIKIADNYAFYLHIDSDGIPRAIGTSRVGGNLLVNNVPGMFKGLDTPKTLTFDLSDLQLAKSSKEGDGYIKKNFVEILNNYSGKSVDMTLFMAGGGKSMREADPKKRIYAVIESAFIEYECEKDSACEIVTKTK